ncbi:glycoside hydrolase [Mucilaginibacter sp. RS28]|uniref:Glycoside hydrolase n=1 Tax=Mucilaginibacter straminoryzae TaxID=2932774 RepID=A0A9X1X055_9SPHI|nr:glycoside hydrolase [Mucilaginibacter straminoryzae]MCJ8208613.1 glycoside hydrolase [Mucilaginibacter straminoryzae]
MMKNFNKRFFALLAAVWITLTVSAQPAKTREISADFKQISGPLNRNFLKCVGAGRANEGLRADWQRQLRMAKQECGFEYIRFHGLLADDMGVYREERGRPVLNWQYIDELFDFLISIKMKPFVEIGFMPAALASGDKTIFWWKGNITPPKDYNKWNDLIRSLVKHWTERYGREEVKTWYFEVWNEPNLRNLFFSGSHEDYFKLYRETASAVKSVDAVYRVGGPGSAGNAWIPDLINFCSTNKVPIDFISTHDYGVKQGYLDTSGRVGTIINPNKNSVANNMARSRKAISNSAIPGLELHYTEWSTSYTPSDPIHDTYEEAAYILNTVNRAANDVNSMSYWTFTDIFEEQGPRATPFHGGFGLINYQDIKKPAYYAYKFLNELGGQRLANADSSAIICKDKSGNVQALLWDCTIDHPGDSTNNQVFYKRLIPAKPIGSTRLKLRNLPAGKYRVEVYQTGYRVNDVYATYHDLGSPSQLTLQQVATIKKNNSGAPLMVSTVTIGSGGTFEKVLNMRQNDVYFVKLIKL